MHMFTCALTHMRMGVYAYGNFFQSLDTTLFLRWALLEPEFTDLARLAGQ